MLAARLGVRSAIRVRLVRGSHVMMSALYAGDHAFILQKDDGPVEFMIPYADRFRLSLLRARCQAPSGMGHDREATLGSCRRNRSINTPMTVIFLL